MPRQRFTDTQIDRMAEEAVRQLRRTPKTPSGVRRLDASDFFVFDGEDVTDAEAKALVEQGIRDEVRRAINRITGRVD